MSMFRSLAGLIGLRQPYFTERNFRTVAKPEKIG